MILQKVKANFPQGGETMLYNRHIDTFLCVARLGSFSKAADELHLTPAGVGKHIDDLENIIERKLFD